MNGGEKALRQSPHLRHISLSASSLLDYSCAIPMYHPEKYSSDFDPIHIIRDSRPVAMRQLLSRKSRHKLVDNHEGRSSSPSANEHRRDAGDCFQFAIYRTIEIC